MIIRLLAALVLFGSADARAAACASAVAPSAWVSYLEAAEQAFSSLDEDAFDRHMDEAAIDLPCLSAPLSPEQAARYHRLVGLRLYVRDDEESARLAFAAARAIEPMGVLPSALLPPGHEARELADRASTAGEVESVLVPKHGELWFDGTPGTDRPVDRPTVVQVQIGDAIEASRYVAPGEALPPYTAAPLASPRVKRRIALATGAGLGVSSAVLYGVAASSAARLEGPLPPEEWMREDVVDLAHRTNGLVAASAVTGVLGGVSVGFAVFRW